MTERDYQDLYRVFTPQGLPRDRPALPDHAFNKQTAAMKIQTGVSVGHEDLLVQVKT